jgi:hypothetical protein
MRITYFNILIGISAVKMQVGKMRCISEDNIKMKFGKIICKFVHPINLAQDIQQ